MAVGEFQASNPAAVATLEDGAVTWISTSRTPSSRLVKMPGSNPDRWNWDR